MILLHVGPSTKIAVEAATSSSTAYKGLPSNMIDGKGNGGIYDGRVCAHTAKAKSWMKLNLGATTSVVELRLVGRKDYPKEKQSSGWIVHVGSSGKVNLF